LNLIVHDYLRTILGLVPDSPFLLDPSAEPPPYNPEYGNQASLGFAYVYRWHSAIGEDDESLLKSLLNKLPTMGNNDISQGLPAFGLERTSIADNGEANSTTRGGPFKDEDIARELRRAMNQIAGHPGALHVPPLFKEFEVKAINQGRNKELDICTLNEYREHFKLKKYYRFEEINTNPKVVAGLKKLYATPDDVELYPGLVAEQTQDKPGGVGINTGIGLGYTTVIGILQDAVNLIRNDRFYTTEFTPKHLTEFGYKLAKDPASVGVQSYNKSIMAHLLSLLNNQFAYSDPHVADPFRVLN